MASFAATQLEINSYAQNKLPIFHTHQCFYTRRSLEQCTSERIATYKASQFKGNKILILAAGLGVDDWAFSFVFNEVLSVDPDEELNEISTYNFNRLERKNIQRLSLTAEAFLDTNKHAFDLVYVDPDRRTDANRQILLSQHQPNIIKLIPKLKQISNCLLLKCSPMFDHEMAKREIDGIQRIDILSYKGEVKEMLLLIDFKKPVIEDYEIRCVEVDKTSERMISFSHSDNHIPLKSDKISGYFYEASSGIIKIRKHHHYAFLKGLNLIDMAVPFYYSELKTDEFMGRCLHIKHVMSFQAKAFTNYLLENRIMKCNIKVRGLKFNTADVYKKTKVKEGGEDYFFIFPYQEGTCIVHCRY